MQYHNISLKNIVEGANAENAIDMVIINSLFFLEEQQCNRKTNTTCSNLHQILNNNFVIINSRKGHFILCKKCKKIVKGRR